MGWKEKVQIAELPVFVLFFRNNSVLIDKTHTPKNFLYTTTSGRNLAKIYQVPLTSLHLKGGCRRGKKKGEGRVYRKTKMDGVPERRFNPKAAFVVVVI